MKRTKYCRVDHVDYSNKKRIESGLVKNFDPPVDTIYLWIGGYTIHLRADEVYQIIKLLSQALFTEYAFTKWGPGKEKVVWETDKQFRKNREQCK